MSVFTQRLRNGSNNQDVQPKVPARYKNTTEDDAQILPLPNSPFNCKSSCVVCQGSNQSTAWLPSNLFILLFFPSYKKMYPTMSPMQHQVPSSCDTVLMAWISSSRFPFIFKSSDAFIPPITSVVYPVFYVVISCFTVITIAWKINRILSCIKCALTFLLECT